MKLNLIKDIIFGALLTSSIGLSTTAIVNQKVIKGEQGIQGIQGEKGDKGDTGEAGIAGSTPVITIGENGNWFIDGVDTGTRAQGEKGETGETGSVGATIIVTNDKIKNLNWYIPATGSFENVPCYVNNEWVMYLDKTGKQHNIGSNGAKWSGSELDGYYILTGSCAQGTYTIGGTTHNSGLWYVTVTSYVSLWDYLVDIGE